MVKEEFLMKKLIYYFCLLTIFSLYSCEKEELLQDSMTPKSLNDYKFVFKISTDELNLSTRSFSNKSDWEINDIIYIYIEGNKNEVCKITYLGDGQWSLDDIKTSTPFASKQGKLTAIYATNIDYVFDEFDYLFPDDELFVQGDILFTEDGTYEKKGEVICITLNMNKRPLNRIIIEGVDNGTTIESLTSPYKLKSSNPIIWDTNKSVGCFSYYNDSKTAVYFGVLDSYNDATKIRLRDNNGYIYERTYNHTPVLGESIIIYGPLSSQSDQWEKKVFVDGITLDKTALKLSIGDYYSLQANLKHPNATNPNLIWSSSNPAVATVNDRGYITAIQTGNAVITVTAEDGSAEASCNVTVASVEEFIEVGYNQRSFSNAGGIQISFNLSIYNGYSKPITIVDGLGFSSNNIDVLTSLSKFEASLSTNEIAPQEGTTCLVNLNFSKYFGYRTGTFYGNQNYVEIHFRVDGKYYTIKKYLPWELY